MSQMLLPFQTLTIRNFLQRVSRLGLLLPSFTLLLGFSQREHTNEPTPLHRAAAYGSTATILNLLQAKAAIEARDGNAWTPLHQAVYHDKSKSVRVLLLADATVDPKDREGNTPLHLAAAEGYLAIVKSLLNYGASKTAINKEGKTPYDLVPDDQSELKALLSPDEQLVEATAATP